MKKLKRKPEIPTLLSVLKQIDERIKYRYYVEIDTSPQDKFEIILDDIERLIQKIICQECQGSGSVNDGGTFGQFRKCDCCHNGIKNVD